jgi:hypothetical protein
MPSGAGRRGQRARNRSKDVVKPADASKFLPDPGENGGRAPRAPASRFDLTARPGTDIVGGSQYKVTVSIEARPKKRACQLDAPLEPEPRARQRAPDQFFAENSKGE